MGEESDVQTFLILYVSGHGLESRILSHIGMTCTLFTSKQIGNYRKTDTYGLNGTYSTEKKCLSA